VYVFQFFIAVDQYHVGRLVCKVVTPPMFKGLTISGYCGDNQQLQLWKLLLA